MIATFKNGLWRDRVGKKHAAMNSASIPSPLAGEGQDGGTMNKTIVRALRKNSMETKRAFWRHLRMRQYKGL